MCGTAVLILNLGIAQKRTVSSTRFLFYSSSKKKKNLVSLGPLVLSTRAYLQLLHTLSCAYVHVQVTVNCDKLTFR